MTWDDNGRDLAFQAERLAADQRDEGEQRIADMLVTAFLIGIVFGSMAFAMVTFR